MSPLWYRAIEKGVECILKTQVRVNGKLTVWCAQHDEVTLEPAPARSYELVSLSGAESVGVVRFLMGIENPKPEVVLAIQGAVAWFREVKLTGFRVESLETQGAHGHDRFVIPDPQAGPLWGRFYEIETNRPFFSGRDGVKKYQLSQIEYERRNGYAWYGSWPMRLLEEEYPRWLRRVEGRRD